jgi:hypothetical protein
MGFDFPSFACDDPVLSSAQERSFAPDVTKSLRRRCRGDPRDRRLLIYSMPIGNKKYRLPFGLAEAKLVPRRPLQRRRRFIDSPFSSPLSRPNGGRGQGKGFLLMVIRVRGIRFKASVVLLVMLGAAIPAQAGLIIDQQNTVGTLNVGIGTSGGTGYYGQSFTPTLTSIGFATFTFYTVPTSNYEVEILSGAGFGGSVLGTSNLVASPAAYQSVEFDFATAVTLTPGNVYTLELLDVSLTDFSLQTEVSPGNPYAGGQFYYPYAGYVQVSQFQRTDHERPGW